MFDLVVESSLITGFLFAWRPEMLAYLFRFQAPTLTEFLYGASLAIISFIGLESISQAAQETRRPATIIPRTSLTLIFADLCLVVLHAQSGCVALVGDRPARGRSDRFSGAPHSLRRSDRRAADGNSGRHDPVHLIQYRRDGGLTADLFDEPLSSGDRLV